METAPLKPPTDLDMSHVVGSIDTDGFGVDGLLFGFGSLSVGVLDATLFGAILGSLDGKRLGGTDGFDVDGVLFDVSKTIRPVLYLFGLLNFGNCLRKLLNLLF